MGRDVVDAIRKAAVATGGNFQVNNGKGYGVSWDVSGVEGFDGDDTTLEVELSSRWLRRELRAEKTYGALGVEGKVGGGQWRRYVDLERNSGASSMYQAFSRSLNAILTS